MNYQLYVNLTRCSVNHIGYSFLVKEKEEGKKTCYVPWSTFSPFSKQQINDALRYSNFKTIWNWFFWETLVSMGVQTTVFPLKSIYGVLFMRSIQISITPSAFNSWNPLLFMEIKLPWSCATHSPLKPQCPPVPTCGPTILVSRVGSIFQTQSLLVLKLMQKVLFFSFLHPEASRVRNILLFLFWADWGGGRADSIYVGVNEEGKRMFIFSPW